MLNYLGAIQKQVNKTDLSIWTQT